MHINVHTLTHIYMRGWGDEREHIHIYQVIHHQSARVRIIVWVCEAPSSGKYLRLSPLDFKIFHGPEN